MATTRLAMLKKQEADVAYALFGALAEEVRRDSQLEARTGGYPQHPVGGVHRPAVRSRSLRGTTNACAWRRTTPSTGRRSTRRKRSGTRARRGALSRASSTALWCWNLTRTIPQKAKQLLAEAGYASGFEAGDCTVDNAFTGLGEALVNDLVAVGIRAKMRPMERAADQAAHREKTHKTLALQGSGAFGNAAVRLDTFVTSKGSQSWIKDPQIDDWYAQQAKERDPKQREALLHRIQQKLYDEVRFIPIWDLGGLHASGPRVAVSGIGLIPLFAFSGPYEDVQLKS